MANRLLLGARELSVYSVGLEAKVNANIREM